MSIERADGVVYIKGAVESVLPLCVAGVDNASEANDADGGARSACPGGRCRPGRRDG